MGSIYPRFFDITASDSKLVDFIPGCTVRDDTFGNRYCAFRNSSKLLLPINSNSVTDRIGMFDKLGQSNPTFWKTEKCDIPMQDIVIGDIWQDQELRFQC